MVPSRSARLWPLLAAALVLAGCEDPVITEYRAPKDSGAAPAAATAPGLHWTAPAGWQAQSADGMRQGSYVVAGTDGAKADMSVISFPGDVGGDLANLNRWRGQVQLPPVGPADLAAAFTRVDGPAGEFLVTDLLGESAAAGGAHPSRILGAILKQADQTWFFKLAGDAGLVEAQKPAFLAFLQSIEAGSAGPPQVAGPQRPANTNDLPPDARGPLPPGHPPIGAAGEAAPGAVAGSAMVSTPVAVAPSEGLVWSAPPQWTPSAGSAMRKGSYAITGPEGAADLAITAFPGDVGGNLANVNRWRGQLGLPPVESLDGALEPLAANGLQMLVFDGANQGTRMIGAIVPRANETWFFKLTGPDALVARTKPAFLEFLQTVKAP